MSDEISLDWRSIRDTSCRIYTSNCPQGKLTVQEGISDSKLTAQIIWLFENRVVYVYPAKTYFDAIIYARCLERYFGASFYDSLDSPDLLPDDRNFVKYTDKKLVYDNVILHTGRNIWKLRSIQENLKLFKQEFSI